MYVNTITRQHRKMLTQPDILVSEFYWTDSKLRTNEHTKLELDSNKTI